jgi:hypothetical protein
MEETMTPWTIGDLMHLTRNELCELAELIEHWLPGFEAGSIERHNALISLANIGRVKALRRRRLIPDAGPRL